MTVHRLTIPACVLLLSTAAAHAQDRLYRINSAELQAYSGVRLTTTVIAPDGSKVNPFQAPAAELGNVGPPGFSRSGITTGLYVLPNQLEEWGGFYEWLGGDTQARLCVNKVPADAAEHQCLGFNGQTGEYTEYASDAALVRYTIAPIEDSPHWFYVSITFRTALSLPSNTQAFPYVQVRPTQRFALWKWRLTTGQAP